MVAPPAITRRTRRSQAFAVFPVEAAAAHWAAREHHCRPRGARRWLLQVYGYVNREVTSAATRLDHFLSEQGAAPDQKITIVSDGAGEFEKAVDGSKRPLTRILDWFHIAMKFRAIEQSALKFPDLLAPNGRTVQDEIASAKWLTWHGKGSAAVERIKSIHDMLGVTPEHPAYSALWWNLRGTYWYFESNGQYLVNYGWRYRRGMPISSSIAESAVNEVVSLRCAKKRQMRWTNKGHTCSFRFG